jgi:CRISPR-associated helicase Cas3/CRISPR-associated endonuclease Cas3-HD
MSASYLGPFFAHSHDAGRGAWEPLRDHLQHVAAAAQQFASVFGAGQQAYAAGLLHDLGKYSEQFLGRLEGREPSRDHWTAGAELASRAIQKPWGLAAALAIAGHHVGLAELKESDDLAAELSAKFRRRPTEFTEGNLALLEERFAHDGLAVPPVSAGFRVNSDWFAADMLDVRMLFSALVDADFLETEAHFEGDTTTLRRPRAAGPPLDVDRALETLERHVDQFKGDGASSPMNDLRRRLFDQCAAAGASSPTGVFTLSAPTGAGKTLAMLAFALRHARSHGLRRIVLVLPFLNIIDQAAAIYRQIFSAQAGFPPHYVLEHHSLADREAVERMDDAVDEVERLRRLLSENWDAPIVLTTSVQCLESLHAHRPARCRKLHRLAKSVILLDEVQTLPPKLAALTLATFSRLADPNGPFGSSIVLATATQPAFESLSGRVADLAGIAWRPPELATDPGPMYRAAAARVRVEWRHEQPIELAALAEELAADGNRRVLAIVNLKRHAAELANLLRERCGTSVLHLSTNMCPAHRLAVLADVSRRLASESAPVRLVSTQCVEAGVDLDFPVVYRALGPLEAIAQAAGRCNRHGTGPRGRVVVVRPRDDKESEFPPGYGQAVQVTLSFLEELRAERHALDDLEIINDPAMLRLYFDRLYHLSGRVAGRSGDERKLIEAIERCNFADVAAEYRLIVQDAINVLVPYDRETFDRLCEEIQQGDLSAGQIRGWMRRATTHAVSLFRPREDSAFWRHVQPVQFSSRYEARDAESQWFLPLPDMTYDRLVGLVVPDDDLVV